MSRPHKAFLRGYYADFLIRIFDLWFRDLKDGRYISIRHLDNWIAVLLGRRPEACDMTGKCSIQFVTESDGSVYPCDFYALDEWKIGTVGRQSLEEMEAGATARRFVEDSCRIPEECHACPAYPLCHNGCRRSRIPASGGLAGRFRFCDAYRRFFEERCEELRTAAQIVAGLHGRWS